MTLPLIGAVVCAIGAWSAWHLWHGRNLKCVALGHRFLESKWDPMHGRSVHACDRCGRLLQKEPE